ncbi:flagellar protein FliT [uncultured Enterobacter sp.]|uniref:flagellar protein FliT n=1 Tax=uncultured Enterobacter sp. TaxID=238202 RepID=UPI002605EF7B|nr:flagellar protein FliT [uncultured Enterobacter sp.]
MDKAVIELIGQLMASNATLQQQAEAGEWDAFLDETAAYAMGMRTLCDIDLTQLAQHIKPRVTAQLAQLLENDVQLTRAMQCRLTEIGTELSAMRKSCASAKAYTAV